MAAMMGDGLASYASHAAQSLGRIIPEPDDSYRSIYARDRDRIIHASAFRRLKQKTQVFVAHEGDHFRTRLTHSLEVAQVARSIARGLKLDEDLTEALALAHDLGHTPFGHAGERELDTLMKPYGGFDHNAHTLRILTELERKYAGFDGLNLTWETLEGVVKHNGPLIDAGGHAIGPYQATGIPAAIIDYVEAHDLRLGTYASAEAQVAALSDDIAYDAHDIDDGLRARLFNVIDLSDIPLAGQALEEVLTAHPKLETSRVIHETVRRIISAMVRDVLQQSARNLRLAKVHHAEDIRLAGQALISFSDQMGENNRVLQRFLAQHVYKHPRVTKIMIRARRVIHDLFTAYMSDASLLPAAWRDQQADQDKRHQARAVCDFLAGMTDNFALEQHRRLFDLAPLFR